MFLIYFAINNNTGNNKLLLTIINRVKLHLYIYYNNMEKIQIIMPHIMYAYN